jgi:Ni,Fe-hydrogenase III small subunit
MFRLFRNEINRKKSLKKPMADGELHRLQRLLKDEIKEKFSSKLRFYIIDTGSCNACEVELQTLFNPLYNVKKLGMEVVYEIKDADILLVTGLLTENMYPFCLDAYQKLNEPKHMITVGDCPLFQAPFKDNFAIKGQVHIHFSTQHHIRGCPPDPKSILRGVLKYLQKL